MGNTTRFKHMANSGDVISCLAGLKKHYQLTGKKVIISQQLNVLAQYYAGASHPVTDNQGRMVCMNEKQFEMLKPLVESQEYIDSMEVYTGQKFDYDIDVIRQKTFVNMPHMALQQWIMLAFPDLGTDLSKPWLDIPHEENICSGKILLNFTDRYRNHTINYFFLRPYQKHLIFAGAKSEHEEFCKEWKIQIPYLQVQDFLELAKCIKSAKFLIGNQSMCWNIAEAMKTPRILEMSSIAPNCQPFIGEDSLGFFHQTGVEYYVNLLFKK